MKKLCNRYMGSQTHTYTQAMQQSYSKECNLAFCYNLENPGQTCLYWGRTGQVTDTGKSPSVWI